MNKEQYNQKFGKAEVKETKKIELVGIEIVATARSTELNVSTVTQTINLLN